MEIERKFLIDRVPAGLSCSDGIPIDQGYLAIDPESEVRLRRAGEALTLTVKNGRGECRRETEVELDGETFDDLWPDTEGRRVEKVRRKIALSGGLTAELDEYAGELEGLRVVEVEFDSEEAATGFEPPYWFGRELTGDRFWANQSLAVDGRPDKGLEYRLRPGEPSTGGICRVVAARAAQAAAAVRVAGSVEDSAGHVHDARKSLKKARSALRMLRGAIDDEERRQANAACRDAAARLSGARDAEVKLWTLDSVTGERSDLGGAAAWRNGLEDEAERHRGDLTPEGLGEAARAIDSVRRSFQGRRPDGSSEQVAGNVGRAYRRGRKAMGKARKSGEAGHFHDWRKRAKDLRYQLEILEPRLPGEFTAIRKQAEELADQLGQLHDFDVLSEDLDGRDLDERDRSRLAELIGAAREARTDSCLDLGRETYALKPGRFTDRVGEELSGEA